MRNRMRFSADSCGKWEKQIINRILRYLNVRVHLYSQRMPLMEIVSFLSGDVFHDDLFRREILICRELDICIFKLHSTLNNKKDSSG